MQLFGVTTEVFGDDHRILALDQLSSMVARREAEQFSFGRR